MNLQVADGQTEAALTSVPCRMDDVWTENTIALYSCLAANHGDKVCTNVLTIHMHQPT